MLWLVRKFKRNCTYFQKISKQSDNKHIPVCISAKYLDKMTLVVLCVKKSMANMEIRNIFLDY